MDAKVWNQIPAHIRDMLKNAFKNRFKSLLLENLKKTNRYYPELIKTFHLLNISDECDRLIPYLLSFLFLNIHVRIELN